MTEADEIAALKEAICYCPDTGELTWAIKRSGTRGIGSSAGGVTKPLGYVQFRFNDRLYYGHRVAFALMTGRWPTMVDHMNGDRADNRWCNLREVTRQMNQQNFRRAMCHSKTGLLGVSPNKKRFMARINVGGKVLHLGTYDTPEQAHAAYLDAKRKHHAGATI